MRAEKATLCSGDCFIIRLRAAKRTDLQTDGRNVRVYWNFAQRHATEALIAY